MENFQEQPNIEQKEQTLEDFQKEIGEMQKAAQKKNKVNANPDLKEAEPELLKQEDMEMWQRCKDLTADNITEEDMSAFQEYRKKINLGEGEPVGRVRFVEFLTNKLSGPWLEKLVREKK